MRECMEEIIGETEIGRRHATCFLGYHLGLIKYQKKNSLSRVECILSLELLFIFHIK